MDHCAALTSAPSRVRIHHVHGALPAHAWFAPDAGSTSSWVKQPRACARIPCDPLAEYVLSQHNVLAALSGMQLALNSPTALKSGAVTSTCGPTAQLCHTPLLHAAPNPKLYTRIHSDLLAMAFHPDGTRLLAVHRSGTVTLYDMHKALRKEGGTASVIKERLMPFEVNGARFSPDGSVIIAAYGVAHGNGMIGGLSILSVSIPPMPPPALPYTPPKPHKSPCL